MSFGGCREMVGFGSLKALLLYKQIIIKNKCEVVKWLLLKIIIYLNMYYSLYIGHTQTYVSNMCLINEFNSNL